MFGRIFHPKNLFNRPVAESTIKAEHDQKAIEPQKAQPPALIIDAPSRAAELKPFRPE